MNLAQFKFAESHEWLKEEGKTAKVGISDYAQHSLGDIVFINLPAVGMTVKAGEKLCDVESVKAVSEIFSPAAGKVAAVNTELESSPELLNSAPYESWICEIEVTGKGKLLTEKEYEALVKE